MTELLLNNIYLILLLPLWLFLIIMVGRFFSVYVNKNIIYLLTLLSSFAGIVLTSLILWKNPSGNILDSEVPFIKINDFMINLGLYVDKTALIFALVLFLISFFVQLFSISYMQKESKNYRFYSLLNLFNFSMLGLFFSSNLFQTYIFWELVGVCSYLLIGFEYNKKEKSIASKKVFLINRIGDTALIGAILLSSYYIYTYASNKAFTTLAFTDMNTISTVLYAYANTPIFETICILFLIGILAKSAQFPFYTWLQDAMEAKLPVSALLHSATLVASGIFLLLRLLPFYTLEPMLLKIISILGLITAIICSLSACSQINSKKVLAYSTSAQLGLIFFALGILNIKAVFALFIAHAFIKSLLFITLPKENENWNYFKYIIFLISGLSLSGLIFSGMIAKEMITNDLTNYYTTIIAIVSFLTAFYIIRIALILFSFYKLSKSRPEVMEAISIIGLLILNIGFYIYLHKTQKYTIAEPFWSALTAWICVYILYSKKAFQKIPILYPITYNGFYLDKFYLFLAEKVYFNIANASNWIDMKIFSNYKFLINSAKLGVKISAFIENNVMNGAVRFITNVFKKLSLVNLRAQNGKIQRYNTYAYIIITIILICLILGYIAILNFMGG